MNKKFPPCPLDFECVPTKTSDRICSNRYSCRMWAASWELPFEYDNEGFLVVSNYERYDEEHQILNDEMDIVYFDRDNQILNYQIEELEKVGWSPAIDIPYRRILVENYPDFYTHLKDNYDFWSSQGHNFLQISCVHVLYFDLAKNLNSIKEWNRVCRELQYSDIYMKKSDSYFLEYLLEKYGQNEKIYGFRINTPKGDECEF